MIGTQPTGAIEGVQISAVSHEGLSVSINGKPGRLAIITRMAKSSPPAKWWPERLKP